jgi:hypothetical protein
MFGLYDGKYGSKDGERVPRIRLKKDLKVIIIRTSKIKEKLRN